MGKLRDLTMREATRSPTRTRVALWLAVFAGPIGWSHHILTRYFAHTLICGLELPGPAIILLLVTASSILPTVAGIVVGFWFWEREPSGHAGRDVAGDRRSFMALFAVLSNIFFLLAILAEALPALVLPACG